MTRWGQVEPGAGTDDGVRGQPLLSAGEQADGRAAARQVGAMMGQQLSRCGPRTASPMRKEGPG